VLRAHLDQQQLGLAQPVVELGELVPRDLLGPGAAADAPADAGVPLREEGAGERVGGLRLHGPLQIRLRPLHVREEARGERDVGGAIPDPREEGLGARPVVVPRGGTQRREPGQGVERITHGAFAHAGAPLTGR
jgi:hypothetical protein